MRRIDSPSSAAKPARRVQWVCVDPPRTPPLSVEEILALNAADEAKALAKASRPPRYRQPVRCRVGYSFFSHCDRQVPYLRLRGGWLAALGFSIGTEVRVACRGKSIVLTRVD